MTNLKEIANEQYYNGDSPILTDEEFNLISDQSRLFKHLVGEPSFKIKSPQENIYPLALNSSVAF